MDCIKTDLSGVMILAPQLFLDYRGWFVESYSFRLFSEHGIDRQFVQDNHSFSKYKGTIRGLHFQNNPYAQSKLVRCTKGSILDVAVDLRRGSPDYCKWISIELSEENGLQLFIPKGFAHGFVTLRDYTEVQYKVDEYYEPLYDRSIRYDDPLINIKWGIEDPILSDKDINAPYLADSDVNFVYKRDEAT